MTDVLRNLKKNIQIQIILNLKTDFFQLINLEIKTGIL